MSLWLLFHALCDMKACTLTDAEACRTRRYRELLSEANARALVSSVSIGLSCKLGLAPITAIQFKAPLNAQDK